ncbi:MAG: transcription antitermination factor NusB [Clostridia bacterium]|nr:transcription antitermination factor NusB [Clostridia bacterium]
MTRSMSRETAFLLLFEYGIKGNETKEEIIAHTEELTNFSKSPYAESVFFGCIDNLDAINEKVDKCLVGWKKQRLSYVSRALLTLATYEMMFAADVPYKVAINEAVELSKKYDDDKAYTFINGVLNAVAEELGLK